MKKKLNIILASILIISSIAGCSNQKKEITIASKPMTEQYILAEILTQLIEKDTEISVIQKLGIGGGTSNIHPGMISGEIDLYPEYTGTGLLFVLKEELIRDPQELYNAVKQGYDEEYDIYWSDLYGFNDTYGLAVKKDLAQEYGLETYDDLSQISQKLRFGAEYDFYERDDGFPGLLDTYGFDFKETVELDIGLKYVAISTDNVDVINVFSTDAMLKKENLVVLKDNKLYFPSYFAATLVRNETLKEYPELQEVIEKLSNQISDEEMIEMNYLVEVENQDPAVVAAEFLAKKGL